jgi:methylmalonyl-CoA mutase N-terminal domain/subunit
VASTIDPLGGSYYVEYLTNEIERHALEYMAKIEARGGIVEATERGWLHKEIADSAHRHQQALGSGELRMVGVNCFRVDEETPIDILRISGTPERQRAKLERLRKQRDEARVEACLNRLTERCHNGENLLPSVLEAVKTDATIGEITDIFRQEFGGWRMPLI